MSALAGDHSFGGTPLAWNLFFARHPEPDLEFTEEELEQTTSYRSSPPPTNAPKPSGGGKRPLILMLLLVLIGGGAYVATEPDMFMEYLGPLLGESPAPQAPPPAAMKPAVPKPTPHPPMAQAPAPEAPAPAAPATETSSALTSPPPVIPTTSSIPAVTPPPTPSAESAPPALAPPAPTAASAGGSPTPLFGEGQRVIVLPNQASPGNAVPLMHDAAGTKPNLAVPAGTVLTILDGDLQNSGWVYFVRSSFGDKGWIIEKQLKLKP